MKIKNKSKFLSYLVLFGMTLFVVSCREDDPERKLNSDCWVKPVDFVEMTHGVATYVNVGSACEHYYLGLYESELANSMSDDEIRTDLESNNSCAIKVSFPENTTGEKFESSYKEIVAWYDEINPNTNYTIVGVPYENNGRVGIVSKTSVSTKSDKNQASVNLEYIGIKDRNYCWEMTMDSNCSGYYAYACASENEFDSYKRDDSGLILATKLKKEMSLHSNDVKYPTSINVSEGGNFCREFIYPKYSNNFTLMDFPRNSSDKYLHIVLWGFSADVKDAYSGIVTEAKIELSPLNIELTTEEACDILSYQATLRGSLKGTDRSMNVGFMYGTNSNSLDGKTEIIETDNGDFQIIQRSLIASTTYYYKSFATSDGVNYFYGDIKSFTTKDVKPDSYINLGEYGSDKDMDTSVEINLEAKLSPEGIMPSTASTLTLTITGNDNWSLSGYENWITTSKQSGSGNATVTVNISENTNSQERSSDLVVKGTTKEMRYTIKQEGTFAQNVDIGDFDSDEDLDASVEINLDAKLSPEGIMPSTAATLTLTITGNDNWSLSGYDKWITTSVQSGSGNATVTLNISENTNSQERSSDLLVKGTTKEMRFTIKQEGTLSQNVDKGDFESDEDLDESVEINMDAKLSPEGIVPSTAATLTLTITGNDNWSLSGYDNWITTSKQSGSGNAIVTVNVSENTNSQERSSDLVVKGTTKEMRFTIKQEGTLAQNVDIGDFDPDEDLDESVEIKLDAKLSPEGSVPGTAATLTLTITGNDNWSLSGYDNWITTSKQSGTGNAIVTVNVSENTNSQERSSDLVVKGTIKEMRFTIKQEGALAQNVDIGDFDPDEDLDNRIEFKLNAEIRISNSLPADASSFFLTITGNDSWVVECNDNWLSFSKNKGNGNATVTVSAYKNTDTKERKATFYVKGINSKETKKFVVTQDGANVQDIEKGNFDDDSSLDDTGTSIERGNYGNDSPLD